MSCFATVIVSKLAAALSSLPSCCFSSPLLSGRHTTVNSAIANKYNTIFFISSNFERKITTFTREIEEGSR